VGLAISGQDVCSHSHQRIQVQGSRAWCNRAWAIQSSRYPFSSWMRMGTSRFWRLRHGCFKLTAVAMTWHVRLSGSFRAPSAAESPPNKKPSSCIRNSERGDQAFTANGLAGRGPRASWIQTDSSKSPCGCPCIGEKPENRKQEAIPHPAPKFCTGAVGTGIWHAIGQNAAKCQAELPEWIKTVKAYHFQRQKFWRLGPVVWLGCVGGWGWWNIKI
jgi:hypothetical protein